MADTRRILSALQTLLADNTAGDISAQDVRDFLVSASPVVEEYAASSSATIDFTTGITSLFDLYTIDLINVIPATNTQNLYMQFSTDGGSTWAATNYYWSTIYWRNDGAGVASSSGGGSSVALSIAITVDTTSGNEGANATITIPDPANTASRQIARWHQTFPTSTGVMQGVGGGVWNTATAINAVRFKFASGNIASGTFRMRGV